MSNDVVIQVDSLSKRYRLGVIGTGTLSHDLNRWWARFRGKPDPYLKIGQKTESRKQKAEINAETGDSSQRSPVTQPSAFSLQPTAFPDDPDFMWALRDVSFEVKRGEVLGIIGRNGAGKSTLLKLLSRVTAPTTGQIRIKGRIASLLEVGTGFHPELTGRENIFLNGAILGMTKLEVRSKLDEIVGFSGVEKHIDTPVKRYSSGMYVRLAFAVAAHLDPEILVVDEVLAVGDAEFQKKCLGKMQDISIHQGRTILFVSHNMAAIGNLCTRGILLNNGQILANADIDTVVHKYLVRQGELSKWHLTDRTDREGTGDVRFTGIRFSIPGKGTCEAIPCGSAIDIELDYQAQKPLATPDIYLGFYDLLDSQLINVNTRMTGIPSEHLEEGAGRFRCHIPELPLPPGDYRINISMEEHAGKQLDRVVAAATLTIIPADFFGTGTAAPAGGKFLLRHRWEHLA